MKIEVVKGLRKGFHLIAGFGLSASQFLECVCVFNRYHKVFMPILSRLRKKYNGKFGLSLKSRVGVIRRRIRAMVSRKRRSGGRRFAIRFRGKRRFVRKGFRRNKGLAGKAFRLARKTALRIDNTFNYKEAYVLGMCGAPSWTYTDTHTNPPTVYACTLHQPSWVYNIPLPVVAGDKVNVKSMLFRYLVGSPMTGTMMMYLLQDKEIGSDAVAPLKNDYVDTNVPVPWNEDRWLQPFAYDLKVGEVNHRIYHFIRKPRAAEIKRTKPSRYRVWRRMKFYFPPNLLKPATSANIRKGRILVNFNKTLATTTDHLPALRFYLVFVFIPPRFLATEQYPYPGNVMPYAEVRTKVTYFDGPN
jgi:hypothetical protein